MVLSNGKYAFTKGKSVFTIVKKVLSEGKNGFAIAKMVFANGTAGNP